MNTKKQNTLMIGAGLASIVTAIFLMILKAIAFFITGSVAMLSSLFDSMQDFMTSLVNIIAIRHAIEPADNQHRFGHGKAQGIGSLIQACIIIMAALLLIKESIAHLLQQKNIADISVGIWVSLIAIILTFCLITFQKWVIKHTNSLCVKTDKAHYTGDILMNAGVLISLVLSSYYGWAWLDGLFGIGVALYLLYSMYTILQEAFAMLMDKELPQATRKKIKALALSVPDVLNVSNLKTRQAGTYLFIQFAVQFDGRITLNKAHDRLDQIEKRLYTEFPESEIMIHAEPFIAAKFNRRMS